MSGFLVVSVSSVTLNSDGSVSVLIRAYSSCCYGFWK